MSDINANLATLVGSRICHDLISPIGAVTNGLELLELSGGMQGPELELISDSIQNAGARIRFFRIAYGAAGVHVLNRPEVVSVLDALMRGGRIKIHWTPPDPMPRAEVRLAFLALQCCETAMPYGGEIWITEEDGIWTVRGTSSKVNVDATLWDRLTQPASTDGIAPAQVHFALLPAVAAEAGRRPKVGYSTKEVSIRF